MFASSSVIGDCKIQDALDIEYTYESNRIEEILLQCKKPSLL